MLLTKEFDYAIRIIRALSCFEKQQVKVICDKEHIPHQFAYKIIKKLEVGGIVTAFRGVNGGYILSKEPNSFTLYDILTLIDENMFVCDCMKSEKKCPNNLAGSLCKVHEEFADIQRYLVERLKSKTMDTVL